MMSNFDDPDLPADAAAGVPIGTVAARTGVGTAVLRAWEQRYGFPYGVWTVIVERSWYHGPLPPWTQVWRRMG